MSWKISSIFIIAVLCYSYYSKLMMTIEPYMDEIFHIPQAQSYCEGNYVHWDPKITTFPGLYYYSIAILSFCKRILPDISCTATFLRFQNSLTLIIFYATIKLVREWVMKSPGYSDGAMVALLVTLLPTNAFYYMLYYTDSASTTFLMLAYLSIVYYSQSHHMSWQRRCLLGLWVCTMSSLAILMRQTNAIWILFSIGVGIVDHMRRDGDFIDKPVVSIFDAVKQIMLFVFALMRCIIKLIPIILPAIVPVLCFIYFVIKNGSIVLGDKDHHKPVFHPAMIMHMLFLSSIIIHIINIIQLLSSSYHNKKHKHHMSSSSSSFVHHVSSSFISQAHHMTVVYHIVGMMMMVVVLRYGSLDHPFLLADNRHYSFYIWQRFLQYPNLRSVLGCVYYPSIYLLCHDVMKARGWIWLCIFLIAAMITLQPAHLLELRYFNPGITILLINYPYQHHQLASSPSSSSPPLPPSSIASSSGDAHPSQQVKHKDGDHAGMMVIISVFLLLDIILLHIFINRPFTWVDGSTARFMF